MSEYRAADLPAPPTTVPAGRHARRCHGSGDGGGLVR
jgi:hypothetical protein